MRIQGGRKFSGVCLNAARLYYVKQPCIRMDVKENNYYKLILKWVQSGVKAVPSSKSDWTLSRCRTDIASAAKKKLFFSP